MFGQPDNQQAGAATVAQPAQNPSMLDNVSTQDLQGQPSPDPGQPAGSTPDPTGQTFAQQHPLTTDDPFAAQQTQAQPAVPAPAPEPATPVVADPVMTADPVTAQEPTQQAASPSQPAPAPVFQADDTNSSTPAADSSSTTDATVDHDKLAGMKQEAMSHLEPLVDHIDSTPEETFKTTMMMIQANDNHTLLDKALEAAKSIEDDKTRAEALLDIINEINYFSQANQPE